MPRIKRMKHRLWPIRRFYGLTILPRVGKKKQGRVQEVVGALKSSEPGIGVAHEDEEEENGIQKLGKDPGIAWGAMQRKDDPKECAGSGVSAFPHATLSHKSQTVAFFQNNFVPTTHSPSSPAPMRDNKTPIEYTQRGKSHSLFSGENEPVPTETEALLSLMNGEESVSIPPTSRSVGRYLFSTQRECNDEDDLMPTAEATHSVFLPRELMELERDASAFLVEEEHVARCSLEEEEVNGRDLLLNAVQLELDTLCFGEVDMEGDQSYTTPPVNAKPYRPVLDNMNDHNELFLRNTRIGSNMDDEVVTPLEKLLRESSPNVRTSSTFNSPANGAYANIYEPPSGKVEAANSKVSSDVSRIGLRAKIASQPLSLGASQSHLSPWCLLETQRHQLEMERRLTQRDRDNLERALDARHQCIQIPSDAHAQLRFEPSDSFTRERQLILGSFDITGQKISRSDTSTPQKGGKEKGHLHHPQHHQQRQQQAVLQPQVHGEGMPGVGVSPISPHTFVSSPSPPKLLAQKPSPRQATIFAEACEAKYKESLTAMKELIELYQAFMKTKPQSKILSGESQIQVNKFDVNEPAAFSTVTYEKRLARIKKLCSSSNTKTSATHYYRRILRTPPLPLSLLPEKVTDGISQNYMSALVKGTIIPPRNSVEGAENTRRLEDSGEAKYPSHRFAGFCEGGVGYVVQKIKPTHFVLDEDNERRGKFHFQNSNAFLPPHRHIKTPPASFGWEDQISAKEVSVSWPVLRWDAQRSENILISRNGTTCMADASRILQLAALEKEQTGKAIPCAKIPMFALGTVGIAEGEFVFEVRIDAHPSSTHAPRSVFAVGVTTKYYQGAHEKTPAYLFRSDGTIVARSDDEKGVPYGCPYHCGSHITVYLSLIRQELHFSLNGQPLGVAFRFRGVEDPEPLFPLVVLGGEGDSASFVPPSAPQLSQHVILPAHRSMRVAQSH
ncbi:hypothetical protein MOQ_004084 [Trypanosoma cruzi marinkellei]|uniref:B30.2/SPRY domain-containing protein n=1 Tax=Trypanosoma cruzi marinkellei TaxID=85056 RepID=K2MAD6_TRYCR|nr:hypothetical protein MOQ_004084 [Trypanosoma cruzi marinkellei]